MIGLVRYFRVFIIFLSIIQMVFSSLFFRFGDLYFFMDESAEVMPVSELFSSGSNDNLVISLGFPLFLMLAFFYVVRLKWKINYIDYITLFCILWLQLLLLLSTEVASLKLSILAPNGWILFTWLTVYVIFWLISLIRVTHDQVSRV